MSRNSESGRAGFGREMRTARRSAIVRKPPLRIVVASHSHPEISNGGAEIAAFQLFANLSARPDCQAWFLGCDRRADGARPGAVISQPFSDREFIYSGADFDWFKFANRDHRFPEQMVRLFADLRPDIAHFHHYLAFGVEVFALVKRTVPNCKIILTLHEYLAICHHFGQMVTRQHFNLCYRSSLSSCAECFPEFSRSDFFLRQRYIVRFLDQVDRFVAPSRFLAKRYSDWGIPEHKLTILENVVQPSHVVAESLSFARKPLRIGFFGQISVLKGINVVFAAAEVLAGKDCTDVVFEVFGDYRRQPPEFQADFVERLSKAGRNVRFRGPYHRDDLDRLMKSVHVVLIPSIWWENSPLVIQEAFRNRRPVICSDIGGMAEKVRDGIDGFHFRTGGALELADLLLRLRQNRRLLSQVSGRMQLPPSEQEIMATHLKLYRAIETGSRRIDRSWE
jgi:glycosyltransferase involved in cell wall biosynthesis